jgi:copper chaperone CopZ
MKNIALFLVVVLASQPSLSGEKQKATILVKGMHCSSCVSMVKKAVRKVQGLEGVSVSLDSAKVDIEYTDDRALPDAIAAITRMGYKVVHADSVGRTSEKATH